MRRAGWFLVANKRRTCRAARPRARLLAAVDDDDFVSLDRAGFKATASRRRDR
jgi:hypothetical protein